MPTINEVIRRVDRIRPNLLEDKDKVRWLMQVDERVYREMTGKDDPERRPAAEGDGKLIIPDCHGQVYDLYLTAMIEFAQEEYEAYNNTVEAYDQAMREYRAWYRREHMPRAGYITL